MLNLNGERSILKFFRLKDTEPIDTDVVVEEENKFIEFYEQRDFSGEQSIELQDRAKSVVKRAKELKKGIKMLPDNLPSEFRKAIDDAVDNITEDIQDEATDIYQTADEVRTDTDNTLYALRRESERYKLMIQKAERFSSIPFIGSKKEKDIEEYNSAIDELSELSTETNTHYENLLYCKSLVKDWVRTEPKEDPEDASDDNEENNNN